MEHLLSRLAALNVRIELRDGKLHVNAPSGVLTPELQKSIAQHRDALIERLQAARLPQAEDQLPRIVPDPEGLYEPFPLNTVQHAYWIGRSSHVELGEVTSHVYFEFECAALDPERLTAAFRKVVAHHGMLRAVIDVNGWQRILESVPAYEIAVLDLRDADPDWREAEEERVRREMSEQEFSSQQWPQFDIRLLQLAEDHSRLCVSWDFLVVDAWSLSIIFEQWHGYYQDPDYEVQPTALSFRDYVLAESQLRGLPSYRRAQEYWWKRIDDLPPAPQLPVSSRIERGRKHRFCRRRFRLPSQEWEQLKTRGRKAGLTVASLLLGAFAEILNRWSKSAHYSLNLTLFNRLPMHPDVGSIVGDFTNLMVLEIDGRSGESFVERATRIQAQFLDDFEHRQVGAVEVLRELVKRRGWQQRAILPVVFTSTLMLDGQRGQDAGGWERFGPLGYGISQTPQVFLDCQIFEVHGDLVIHWDTVDELFPPGVLDDMFSAQRQLLESLANDPDAWQAHRPLGLPDAQRPRRQAVNDTAAEVVHSCLHTPFIDRALEDPDRIAVLFGGGEMRYGELLAHSLLVAEHLREKGVERNQLVAVVMHKGWEQVVAVLGVLMAGAAYLPIDPRWPALRRHQILEQGEARIALTQPALSEQLDWPESVERIGVTPQRELDRPTAVPPIRQSTGDLAYVIFTSGSTGTPKGVMIDHRGAVNTVFHVNRLFGVGAEDRVLAVSDLTFDLSVYDIFGLLAAGGAIVIPDAELSRDPRHWAQQIGREQVTVWNSAPPLMGVLADAMESGTAPELSSLRLVLLSGDWVPVPLPDRVKRLTGGAQVVSLGGATEGSIWSIYYPIGEVDPDWDSIPYGRALPNQHMYVLDERLQPSPDLVTGGIYIGGVGVALGYWKEPARTSERFIEHPDTGERLYVTGDLGRFLRDGNIEFLGRDDSQVKLRGYRVELGEIAACLQSHPDLREAVVRLNKEEGRGSLTAYVVADEGGDSRLFERTEVPRRQLERISRRVDESGTRRTLDADRQALLTFSQLWEGIEGACLRSMLDTLQDLGLVDGSDAAERLEELVEEGRVLPQHRRIVERWLRVLASGGHLSAEVGGYRLSQAGIGAGEPVADRLAVLQEACGGDGRLAGFLEYAASCLRAQLSLLSGEVAPLELLFPEGSWRLADALYTESPILQHHNQVIGAITRSLVEAWDGDRMLRVLELGAGTGGTSAAVLPALPAERTEYWYTDLSSFFFKGAGEKFRSYPFIRYSIFDIDQGPKNQGHAPHSYDLVVAANVLHNATDINATLGHVRELLRPGGYLLMLEGTRTNPWQWATISYLEAVTAYGDERAELDAPLLSAERWSGALSRNGFEAVHVFPRLSAADDDELAHLLDAMPQHVIAAQGPAAVGRFKPEALDSFLRDRLPAYMVPQRFVLLDRLPLSANGKVDLRALPREISLQAAEERRVVLPRSETEERILRLWKGVLGVDQLSILDNFFEVGGDSLLMTEVLRKINQTQQPPLTTADLFSYPTVQSLARYLTADSKAEERRSPASPAGRWGRESGAPREIAIIGMAGRFPDAENVEELWHNLSHGRCSVRRFTDEELLEAGVTPDELAEENYVKAGLVLEGIDLFDAGFFGFTPREAEIMDPQQRFLLECGVEALESAGYPSERSAGRIGVFVGKGTSRYLLEHVLHRPEISQQLGLMYVLNLNEKDYAAPHLSYKLNLTGPSVNINTACSTSLVAVHAACQSLLDGECEIALAGGVSFVSTLPRSGYLYHEGFITSPDGLCRAFSDDANGCIFGNGGGLVVLKPLAAALRDRDTIHAVIKGSAINNDGSQKVGFSAPSLHGQAEVIARAQALAGVSSEAIQLVEAHGTGTKLGDPIEFGALRQVFGGRRPGGSRCALGSIKSNIGHLDSGAGIAGLIKVVEALKHKQIPPTLHASVPNRELDLEDSPFYLNADLIEWPASAQARLAAASSFGVGGTNAHVVVAEAPVPAQREVGIGAELLPLSAKSRGSLTQSMRRLAEELRRRPELALEDVAFTLQVGRNAHKYRSYLLCDDLVRAQEQLAEGPLPIVEVSDERSAPVVFLFPGQGVQRHGLTSELYRTQSGFRRALDECAEIVELYTGQDLREWLYGEGAASGEGSPDIDQTAITQPLLFSVEYALAQFLESLGIRPAAMLGQSLGEYVAATLGGVFSLEEVLSLVVVRGQLLQSLEPGGMLAVSCGEERLRELLTQSGCSLAAVNGPMQCVVAGAGDEMEALRSRLEEAEIPSRVLRTSHAFHSSMVEPILATYEECVAQIGKRRPEIPFLSNVSGTWITEAEATSSSYWARHLRETVRFGAGAQELLGLGNCVMLEVGPGHTLSTLVRVAGAPRERVIPLLGHAGVEQGERRAVLDAIAQAWSQGVEVGWEQLHEGRHPMRVPLSTYAFERKRYWIGRWGERSEEPKGDTEPEQSVDAEVPAAGELPEGASPRSRTALGSDGSPPANELEAQLIEIWKTYLGVEEIGTGDNFFELGGDSLLATRVYAQIKKDIGVELPMGKMFELATVKRMYLFIVTKLDPAAIDALSEEELDDLLQVMEA